MSSPRALFRTLLLVLLLGVPLLPATASARQSGDVVSLRSRVERLEREVDDLTGKRARAGAIAFLFGAFCALWAQNTGRSAWLWFVLGVFFSVITVIFLLVKNADDLRAAEPPPFELERYRKQ